MKILVTGAAGMLGSALVPALVGAGHEVVATDIALDDPPAWRGEGPALQRLDVREACSVRDAVDGVAPQFVAHLAAETDLERCDADPDHAYLTNAMGTKHVALSCRRARIPMVYISTAGVFDGKKTVAYTEFDEPRPINTYGHSKLVGEELVGRLVPESYVVRAGWMVGGGPGKDHKFVAKMLNQIKAGRRTLHAVGDKLGTPTYTTDFARTFLGLIESESYGLYHMACEGEGSRYDVAAHILEVLGLTHAIDLVEVGSEFFAEDFPSPRPRSEIMRNMALDLQGMNLMRPWRDALEEYLLADFAELARDLSAA